MSKEENSIDYLFEDPPIPNQQYALVSIVGPHMPQKCDVWGLKVRGTADTLEKAKNMSQKILKIDNNYDIYTVEVGKFFPLVVQPFEVKEVEYQNDQLNTLIKSYLENRENANEQWHSRKNEMLQDAIKEGKSKEKPKEHPISILQQIHMQEEDVQKAQQKITVLKEKLSSNYTNLELEDAQLEFNKMLENIRLENTQSNVENVEENEINQIIEKIKSLEVEREKLHSENDQDKEIERLDIQINLLKEKLNDPDVINSYINNNYQNPQIKLV